jgi:hypothetical protein
MCKCKINCFCALKKINQINNTIILETEFSLTLTDLMTCENLNVVKNKLENITDNLKAKSNKIISICQFNDGGFGDVVVK